MNILFFLTPKSEVAYIPADESLRQAFEKLKYHGYSAVPTLTDDGKYAGTITEGDVLRAMESMCHWNISEAEKVKLMDVKRKRNIQASGIYSKRNKIFVSGNRMITAKSNTHITPRPAKHL